MVAIGLLHGDLIAEHYEEETASDPRVDQLRSLMRVIENEDYTVGYLDPERRAISNRVQVFFTDGTSTEAVEIHYPLGHRRRREESIPVLHAKFKDALAQQFEASQSEKLSAWTSDAECFDSMPVHEFVERWQA